VTLNPRDSKSHENVMAVKSAEFKIGFWSIFTDNFKVHGVRLVKPDVRLVRDKKGNWNYGKMFQPPSDGEPTESEGPDPVFELYSVRIDDGRFQYADLGDGSDILVDSIQLGMKGDFSADRSDIETKFAVHLADWKSGRATWAHNKHVAAHILADVQFGERETYELKTADIDIAALKLAIEGKIGRDGNVFDLDLKFASSKNSFESFLSLLPGGLLDTGREYEYSGDFVTRGWLKGKAGPGQSPDIHADYGVTSGAFHYVGYESRLSNVNMIGEFHMEDKDPSASHFDIRKFKAVLHDKAIAGNMTYANFRDPRLAVALKGELSLQDVRDFYPAFADSTEMSGNVKIDAQVEGRIADFKQKNHAAIKAFGGMRFTALRLEDSRLGMPFENLTGSILLDNHRIEVTSLTGKAGHSDFNIKGTVTEYLPWFFDENATITGVAEMRCANLDLDEWFVADPAAQPVSPTEEKKEESFAFKLPRNVDFQLITQIGKFKFAKFEATAMNGTCRMRDQQLQLDNLQMNTLGGSSEVKGHIKVLDEQHCEVKLDGIIKNVDINKTFRTFEQLAAFALVKENLFGIFSGDVHLSGIVDQDLVLDASSFVSFGNVNIRECKLINFEPLEGLAGFVKLEDLQHIEFSDITTEYRIGESHFYIPKMSLKANRYSMVVLGKHGFDNSLDYKVYVELPRKDAKTSRNKQVLDLIEENQDDPIKIVIPVHITGTVDHPKYSLEGEYVAAKLDEQIKKQGDELKEGWKAEMEETWGAKDTNKVDDLIDVQRDPAESNNGGGAKNVLDKAKKPFEKLKKPFKSIGDRFGN
ncbi:MAG TPA: AsmA-like C-terminal region-containing protein, partial [Bacteroidia bacterium]|nr:AsmA-like C-terminal region-containing protein [Bacteroidia bacterium]